MATKTKRVYADASIPTFMVPTLRTELDGALDLDQMTAYEVLAYAQHHPGTEHDLVRAISARYSCEKIGVLLETADSIGAQKDPLVILLQSDVI